MSDFKTNCVIPDQIKTTIGRLIVVIAATSEPAAKIHYTSSLISEIRSALKIYIRYWKCASADTLLWELISSMILAEANPDEYPRVIITVEKLRKHFAEEVPPATGENDADKAGFDTLRDYYDVESCRRRWQDANRIYFANPDAWLHSNAMLADIHDCLIDIANKRDLIIIPKNTFFSIDELNNYGTFKPLDKEVSHG